MILFINASPRLNKSNSKYFCDLLKIDDSITNYIYSDSFDIIKENIKTIDTIVFAFPTYIDIIPSKLIEFIENYEDDFEYKNIYVICNCGFLESIHNDLSIEYMKRYIENKKGIFKGYFNIGSGEVIKFTKNNKLFRLLCLNFYKNLRKFRKAINNNCNIHISTCFKILPKRIFCIVCNYFWKKQINE